MDDQTGKLSPADKEATEKWLVSKELSPCPSCHHNQFSIGDYAVSLQTYSEIAMVQTPVSYPMVAILCSNCG